MSESRKGEFKGGNRGADVRGKRADNAISLTREKSDQRRRRCMNNDINAERLLEQHIRSFRKREFVEQGNADQLALLHSILNRISKDEFEEYVPLLIMDDETCSKADGVVGALFRFAGQPHTHRQAMEALINLTGTCSSFDVLICNAVVRSGLLNQAPGQDCSLWIIAANITCSCEEAKSVVLNSVLAKQWLIPTLAAAHFESELIVDIYVLICALIDSKTRDPFDTTTFWPFVVAIWPHVMNTLQTLQPMPCAELTPHARVMRTSIISIIKVILGKSPVSDNGMPLSLPLVAPILEPLFAKVGQLAPTLDSLDLLRVMEICKDVSHIPMDFQLAMERTPSIVNLLMRSIQCSDQEIRQDGFLWLGNYMMGSTIHVRTMLNREVVGILLQAIRSGESRHINVRRNAVFALMAMFGTCFIDYTDRIDRTKEANAIMYTLVVGSNIFGTLIPFMNVVGQEDVSINILGIVHDALQWNYAKTMEALSDTEAVDRIDIILADMKGSASKKLYDAAVVVDNLINKRAPEAERMEIDTTDLVKTAYVKPSGVLQGAYSF